MIVKRYGRQMQSVTPDFNAVAMNEIGFRRDHEWSMDTEEFLAGYERVGEHELVASGEGDVQTDVETGVLNTLLADLRSIESASRENDLLVVENDALDYPKLHTTQRTVVVSFENRLHFTYTVDPPLRIGVHRKRG